MKKIKSLPALLILVLMLLSSCSNMKSTNSKNIQPSSEVSYKDTGNSTAYGILTSNSITIPDDNIDNTIFICQKNHLYALDKYSGKLFWRVETIEKREISASRKAINGMVLCNVSNDKTYVLDAKTGNIKYTFKSDFSRDIITHNGGSLFSLEGGEIFCETEFATGKEVWKYRPGGMVGVSGVYNNVMFFGSNNEYFAALDLLTHKEKWRYNTENGEKPGKSSLADGTAYIQTNSQTGNSSIIALDMENGNKKWSFSGIKDCYDFAESNGTVYFGDYSGVMYALDNKTGSLIWKRTEDGEIECSPAVSNGTIYFGTRKGSLYALNAKTGVAVWRIKGENGFRVYSSPKPINGKILFLSTNDENYGEEIKNLLYTADAKTGNIVWKKDVHVLDFDNYIFADNETLFVSDVDGFIYAIDINTGNTIWNFSADM